MLATFTGGVRSLLYHHGLWDIGLDIENRTLGVEQVNQHRIKLALTILDVRDEADSCVGSFDVEEVLFILRQSPLQVVSWLSLTLTLMGRSWNGPMGFPCFLM